ncbi:uncharacterized protein LOC126848036 isoform X2 [Adelges cooleyi]|uniref:uncharacterized protein LOC126848036 isoform X2 n=1 Tax=Adelges cooleyi TaxID=133065 RepID=UPI00217FAF96|nr:uncharacterized protein LOC126848036 isoform X2 [Adelges cooleyi]
MKLFCLLIPIFFVGVLANEGTYMSYIFITTEALAIANDLTVEGTNGTETNALEHVIETMVDNVEKYRHFGKLNFLLAVPDHPEIMRTIPQLPLLPILQKANFFFQIMRQDIERLLELEPINGFYRESISLKQLGDDRRQHVVPALKNVIRRRVLESGQHDEASLLPKCRLLGLYLSTQFPESFIKQVDIDPIDLICILTDTNDTKRYYRKIDNAWSEIRLSNINESLQFLEEQLRLGRPQVPFSFHDVL